MALEHRAGRSAKQKATSVQLQPCKVPHMQVKL